MTAVLGPGRPFTGNERELLKSTLELNRAELVAAVDGLSDAQARRPRRRPPQRQTLDHRDQLHASTPRCPICTPTEVGAEYYRHDQSLEQPLAGQPTVTAL